MPVPVLVPLPDEWYQKEGFDGGTSDESFDGVKLGTPIGSTDGPDDGREMGYILRFKLATGRYKDYVG